MCVGISDTRGNTHRVEDECAMAWFSGLSAGGSSGLAAADFSDQSVTLEERAQLLPT